MNEIKTVQRLNADRVFKGLVCIFAGLTAIPLLAILGEVLMRGCGQLSWSFFTEPTPTAFRAMQAVAAGEPIPGGIANGIIGSVLMLGMATVVAVPIGIMCGVYLAENAKKRFAVVVSYITDLLQGTPSVIIGIITGILLAVSRVIGETAPLMFTALGCSSIRWDIDKPISAVPLLIWEFFNDPNLQELIWGASLFLLIFVLSLNLTAKYFARKWNS